MRVSIRASSAGGKGLDQKTAGSGNDAGRFHENPQSDSRGNLFRLSKVVGQILGDFTASQAHNPLIVFLAAQVLDDGEKAVSPHDPRDVQFSLPRREIGVRVCDESPNVAATIRLDDDPSQRAAPFEFQGQTLVLLQERCHEGASRQGPTQGRGGGRGCVVQACSVFNQAGGIAGQRQDAAVLGHGADKIVFHGRVFYQK